VLEKNPTSLEQFNRAATWGGPKQQITTPNEEEVEEPAPIKQLRSEIKSEILQLVKLQKTSFLKKGTFFKVYKPKTKNLPFIFCVLQEGSEELIWSYSPTNNTIPSELPNKVKLSEVSGLLIGNNSPLFTKQKKISPQDEELVPLSFSLSLPEGKTLDFISQTKEDLINWTDGVRTLLSGKLENPETLDEVASLSNLELRIRVLELGGIEVPNEAPKIPEQLPTL